MARNPSFPVTSKHLYLTFHNAPSSIKARYLLHLAQEYTAMELLTTHLTKILTYPICTQNVLKRYLSLLAPYYYTDPTHGRPPSEQPVVMAGIRGIFTLPKRLFRTLTPEDAANKLNFVKYLCSIPPVYRYLPHDHLNERRKVEPFTPSANVNSHNGYPLIRAVQVRYLPLVELLIWNGADPTKRDNMAIMMAIRYRDLELTRVLMDSDSVDATSSMVRQAVDAQADDIIAWLVGEKGCVPDMRTLRLMG